MADPFATAEQLAARWHALSNEDALKADVLLADAAFWLKVWFREYGDLEVLAQSDELLAQGLEILSCSMVKRALIGGDNEGQASQYQMYGPFSQQVSYKNPEGNLYLSAKEFAGIAALLGADATGAVSMTAPGL